MLPASSPCSRLTTQWTAGAAAGPCETDNRTFEATGLTFTKKSQEPVVANEPTRYRIEIYPTDAIFKKGDQIRFTLNTANTPSTSAPVPQQLDALGGTIRVLHGKNYASNVRLPVTG